MPNTTTSQTITPDTFPAGTRVVFTVGANAGTEATVTGWVRDSIGVRALGPRGSAGSMMSQTTSPRLSFAPASRR